MAINGLERQSRGTLMAINGAEWQSTGHTDGNQRHRVAIKAIMAIRPSTSESVPFTLIVENVGWFQVAMEQRRLACMQVRAARDDVEQRRE